MKYEIVKTIRNPQNSIGSYLGPYITQIVYTLAAKCCCPLAALGCSGNNTLDRKPLSRNTITLIYTDIDI